MWSSLPANLRVLWDVAAYKADIFKYKSVCIVEYTETFILSIKNSRIRLAIGIFMDIIQKSLMGFSVTQLCNLINICCKQIATLETKTAS